MEKLFSSFQLGGLDLVNRFVFPPIKTSLGTPAGEITDRQLRFYDQISKDGPGLVITEPLAVSLDGKEHPKQMIVAGDDYVKKIGEICDIIHENGRKACLHLNHGGAAANPKIIGSKPGSASTFICARTGAETSPLSREDIERIITAFGQATVLAKEAGFDAVELQAGHGYLLAQFLNPAFNKREDEYGTDRTLLAKRVMENVIDNAKDMVCVVRVSGNEMIPGKSTPDEDIDNLLGIAREVGFAAVHVGMGSNCFSPPWYFHHMSLPEEPQEKALSRIKKSSGMPVIAAGRMGTLTRCRKMLDGDFADMIALGRPLIADPDLIAKWAGESDRPVQPCGCCLQGCLVHVKDASGISCNFNPGISLPELGKSDKSLTVLVAGGGPAGLSAARYLSERGHDVTLAEASDNLGGVAKMAPMAPGKEKMTDPIKQYALENRYEKVKFLIGKKVDVDLVKKNKPELLVWATGAKANTPSFKGIDNVHAISCIEAFSGEKEIKGNRVLIIGAGRNGLELAEKLGKMGYQVAATKRTDNLGSFMEPISKKMCLTRIEKMPNVSLMPLTTVLEFTSEGVRVKIEDTEQLLPGFDTVILCAGMLPTEGPPEDITSLVSAVEVVGDASDPGDIYSAVKAGYELAAKY